MPHVWYQQTNANVALETSLCAYSSLCSITLVCFKGDISVWEPVLRLHMPGINYLFLRLWQGAQRMQISCRHALILQRCATLGEARAPVRQVPLMYLTEYLKRKVKSDQVGNFIFWVTFCVIGQPISIILYYHDWLLINRPEWCATTPLNCLFLTSRFFEEVPCACLLFLFYRLPKTARSCQ